MTFPFFFSFEILTYLVITGVMTMDSTKWQLTYYRCCISATVAF